VTNIRAANLQDSQAIAEVHVTAWRETYRGLVPETVLKNLSVSERAEKWRQAILGRPANPFYHPIFVEVQDGEIVGFADGGHCRSAALGQEMEIYAIYLFERVKHRGIGSALLRALIGDFVPQGALSAGLWVLRDNHPARSFYESFGAQRAAERVEHRQGYDLEEVGYFWSDLSFVLQIRAQSGR
jgi:ribosomal protein S18 acetylase RimI-like enzyme